MYHLVEDDLQEITILRYLDNNAVNKGIRYLEIKEIDRDKGRKSRYTRGKSRRRRR